MNSINANSPQNPINKHLIVVLVLASTLALTWVFSLREVRLKIGDYYYNQEKYDQAMNRYERVLRKERLKVAHGGANLLNFEGDLTKLKSALERLNDENLLAINHHIGIEKTKDVNLKSAIRNLLMDLDFSNTVTGGNENYVVAWMAHKAVIKPSLNGESKTSERYIFRWAKEKAQIVGVARLVEGPWENLKAIMVEGFPGLTNIFGPPSAVNSCEGSLAVWARLTDPGKTYSDLVNASQIIYIYHLGTNGKFFIQYNGDVGSASLAIKDHKWHHYVFTWKHGDQKFYIDGHEVFAGTTPVPTNDVNKFSIGSLGRGSSIEGEQWHGAFSQFMTFDRPLNGREVTALYQWRRSSIQ